MTQSKPVNQEALLTLKQHNAALTPQQYKTIRGQILAGDDTGALKGLEKLCNAQRGGKSRSNENFKSI